MLLVELMMYMCVYVLCPWPARVHTRVVRVWETYIVTVNDTSMLQNIKSLASVSDTQILRDWHR